MFNHTHAHWHYSIHLHAHAVNDAYAPVCDGHTCAFLNERTTHATGGRFYHGFGLVATAAEGIGPTEQRFARLASMS